MRTVIAALLTLFAVFSAAAQAPEPPATARDVEQIRKSVDDVLWHLKTGDIANIDKVLIASSKPVRMKNPTGQGAGNPLIVPVYVFTPKNLKGKAPLIVFVHGGALPFRRSEEHTSE